MQDEDDGVVKISDDDEDDDPTAYIKGPFVKRKAESKNAVIKKEVTTSIYNVLIIR